jgi:hypothetical protein
MVWFKKRFRTYGPQMILDALEERIVLDATVDQGAQQNQTSPTVNTGSADAAGTTATNHNASSDGLHVVLVANDVKDADQIVSAKVGDATVIVFDAAHEGLDAINARLAELVQTSGKKISTIAVLGHGEDGVIDIGTDHISEANLAKFISSFQTLGANLTENAQIQFFGCSIAAGENGKALITDIATYTHATVFASTDDTGGGQGNDWVLEYSSQEDTQFIQVLDTNALQDADITLVFTNAPFAWTADPSTYSSYYGDIESSDPNGSRGTSTEFWTFTLTTAGYVSIGAQTIIPENQGATQYLDPWLVILSGTSTLYSNDDWGGATADLNGDGVNDVHVWDSRLVDRYLAAGTYTLEVTHYLWNDQRDFGPYQLLGSYRPNTSSEYTPLIFNWDATHVPPAVMDPEVVTRPIWDVTTGEGFGTYTYDVHTSFGLVGGGAIEFRLVNTDPDFLQSIAIDIHTGVITFTEAVLPGSGVINVTVEAYSGSLSGDQDFTFTVTTTRYDLPSADSSRIWVDQGTSYIIFDVSAHDPDRHSLSQVQFAVDAQYTTQHGTLTAIGTPYFDSEDITEYHQQYMYTPTAGYYGLDGFQFTFSTPGGSWKVFGTAVNVGGTGDSYTTYAVQFADLNNDGFLDIVEGNNGVNKYYLNDGHGNFPTSYSLGTDSSNTRSIAIGDVNRDGWLDVVAGNYAQSDRVYLNAGAYLGGSWLGFNDGVVIASSSSGNEYAVVLGDLNGDGYLDLVRGNYNVADRVHLNDGAGNFNAGTNITSSLTNTQALALGDLNRDGYLDLVVGKGNNNRDRVMLGNGNGTFQAETTLGLSNATNDTTWSVALGDLNNDGWLDVVTANYGTNAKVYLNSSGTFSTQTSLGSTSNTYSVALGDIDRDGFLDVVLSRYNNVGRYYVNAGDGTFGSAQALSTVSANTRSVAVGDVNDDGDLDILYGIDGSVNRIIPNSGFNTGSSTYHTTAPGVVQLNVSLLKYPSFEADNTLDPSGIYQNGSGVGWQFFEENDVSLGSTFATVNDGTSVAFFGSLHDYYDSAITGVSCDELQMSFGLPFKVLDGDVNTNEQIALLLGNQPRHATLWQDVTLPADATLTGVDLQWRMAYQNDYFFLDPTTPFDSTYQYIAVYVYTPDANGDRPTGTQPLWITTNGRDAGVVYSLQDYTVHLPASLVPTTGAETIRVEFELVAQNWFFEVAIDEFALIPVKPSTGSALPPVVPESTTIVSEALVSSMASASTVSTLTAVDTSQTSTSTSSISSLSALSVSTTSSVDLGVSGTTSADLGPSSVESPTFLGSVALADYGFSSYVFDQGSSDTKPVDAAPTQDVAGQEVTVAFNDPATDFYTPAVHDAAPVDVAAVPAVDDAPDPTGRMDLVSDLPSKDFSAGVALILDPTEMSALNVLQAQGTAFGVAPRMDVRDMADRLAAGDALAFDLDAVRLSDV